MTARYAVFGHPVAHSLSPRIHAAFARQLGVDMEYTAHDAAPEDFAAALHTFGAIGGLGANVTLPHKERAVALCSQLSDRAKRAGAVNTLTRAGALWHGDNTDGVGLLRDITLNLGRAIAGSRVLLLGAGGAARGVLPPLVDSGPAALTIANRTARRAEELADLFQKVQGGSYRELSGRAFDLVINATSSGLENQAPPLPAGVFAPEALAYDMVYGRDTPFMAVARAAGAEACDGTGMLVEQAAESFLLWRGMRPETAPVLAALRLG